MMLVRLSGSGTRIAVSAAKKKVTSDVTSRFGNLKVTSNSQEFQRGLFRKTQSRIQFGACVVSIDTNCTRSISTARALVNYNK